MSNKPEHTHTDVLSYSCQGSRYFRRNLDPWVRAMLKKDDDQALAEQRYYIVPDVQEHETAKEVIKKLAESLCEQYPEISTFKGVFNGKPHLKDTRFTVADVLSAICIYNDLGSVLEAYDNEYTEEQFKAAIRYARDFLLSSYSLP